MAAAEERILTNLRKGVVEFCVLAHLRGERAYGFDLARKLEEEGLIASEGTLYPLLTRLRSAGMVETEWVESEAGRPRKYYSLTSLGVDHLGTFERTWTAIRDTVDRTIRRPL